MSRIKDFFIPHEENKYHSHLLHTKRAVFYSGVFVAMKAIVVAFVLLIPVEVYVMPDVVQLEEQQLYTLTNDVRTAQGIQPLTPEARLITSARNKSEDMANGSYFAHTGPDGRSLKHWMEEVGYPYQTAGENLAIGFSDPRLLVSAWVQSPTHYENIVDTDFVDTGIGISAGSYKGTDVLFVTQHFGEQKAAARAQEAAALTTPEAETPSAPSETLPLKEAEVTPVVVATFSDVLGEEETEDDAPNDLALDDSAGVTVPVVAAEDTAPVQEARGVIDHDRSFVRYVPVGDDAMTVTANVSITAPYTTAVVTLGDHIIPLSREESYGVLSGEVTIDTAPNEYFKAFLLPEVTVLFPSGETVTEYLAWEHIPKVSLTPVEAYTTSKPLLTSFTSLFNVTNTVYFFCIGLFSIALLIHIFWNIREQHHHVTVQTLCLLFLLITLIAI